VTNLQIEVNEKFAKAKDSFQVGDGILLITPPLNEEYWAYRVPLKHGQAIVAFPKFGMLGCGFAKEKDWNTNLPLDCKAKEIFAHIKHNKRYRDIPDADCIAAIQALKDFVGGAKHDR
jgi:hypothetical protein